MTREADLHTYVRALEDLLQEAVLREAKQEAVLRAVEAERDALLAGASDQNSAGSGTLVQ